MTINESKLNEFLGKAISDLGAAFSATLVLVGDRLGLYKELAKGAVTSAELAQRTGTNERYVREWLGNQGASGYVQYDPAIGKWSMTPEQALCLADPNGPVDLPGGYNIVEATFHALGRTLENFKSGKGMEWGEHHPCLFHGTERFFRAGYNANLVTSWLPALEGVVDKLKRGARVADVGCGHGASTVLMAKTYPQSTFVGYDYHGESIRVARERAAAAGIANAQFEVSDAVSYSGKDFDVIAFFDCLHDMGDPVGVARHARQALKPDGTAMIVEPFRKRQGSGQSQSGRTRHVRRIVANMRARIPGAKGPCARRPSRRSALARSRGRRRRFRKISACHRDAVQSGAGGAALGSLSPARG